MCTIYELYVVFLACYYHEHILGEVCSNLTLFKRTQRIKIKSSVVLSLKNNGQQCILLTQTTSIERNPIRLFQSHERDG